MDEGTTIDESMYRAVTAVPAEVYRAHAIVGMSDDELTLREIDEVIGVSEARVSQILGKTMLAIRSRIEATVEAEMD